MAHDLVLKTIAEGVETEEQLQYLWQANCYAAQGFYFMRPLTAAKLEEFLQNKYPDGHFPIPSLRTKT